MEQPARHPKRKEKALERWKADTTTAPPPVRIRGRHLEDSSKAFEHNSWDDVEMTAEELAAAEAKICAQPLADAERIKGCVEQASARWDRHYEENLRNYHDRRYLQNEYPTLLHSAATGGGDAGANDDRPLLILETGCGVGNALLPLLALSPRVRALGCDHAAGAVERANERLAREGLDGRGRAFCWDLGLPTPHGELPEGGVDTVLALFTLSALPPDALPCAFAHLAAALAPGGQLLLRDYGRLDLKQLKFASAGSSARLGSGHGCEWYSRGDGTTALFFTTDAVRQLAVSAGLEVRTLGYDKRLTVNRAERKRMHRVWVVAELVKPQTACGSAASPMASGLQSRHAERRPRPMARTAILVAGSAVVLAGAMLLAARLAILARSKQR